MTPPRQPLHRVRLRGFRNLEPLDWRSSAGTHLILGPNGAGKTSLLEAIYLGATTRSFRAARLDETLKHGAEAFHISLSVGQEGRRELEFAWSDKGRRRAMNGDSLSLTEHVGQLPVVLWTALEKELLTGGPAIGRRVLDRGVVSRRPSALAAMGRYRRALDQKRRLLATTGSRETLSGFHRVLAESASSILGERRRYVADLQQALEGVLEGLSLGLPTPTLTYRASPVLVGSEGVERGGLGVEDPDPEALFDAFELAAPREIERRRPLVGPHRDILEFTWDGRELRRVGSAGELKAIGLLLVAAQGSVLEAAGRSPLYLLDDVGTELDSERLATVWSAFGRDVQVIATSSRPTDWSGREDVQRWSMSDGTLAPH